VKRNKHLFYTTITTLNLERLSAGSRTESVLPNPHRVKKWKCGPHLRGTAKDRVFPLHTIWDRDWDHPKNRIFHLILRGPPTSPPSSPEPPPARPPARPPAGRVPAYLRARVLRGLPGRRLHGWRRRLGCPEVGLGHISHGQRGRSRHRTGSGGRQRGTCGRHTRPLGRPPACAPRPARRGPRVPAPATRGPSVRSAETGVSRTRPDLRHQGATPSRGSWVGTLTSATRAVTPARTPSHPQGDREPSPGTGRQDPLLPASPRSLLPPALDFRQPWAEDREAARGFCRTGRGTSATVLSLALAERPPVPSCATVRRQGAASAGTLTSLACPGPRAPRVGWIPRHCLHQTSRQGPSRDRPVGTRDSGKILNSLGSLTFSKNDLKPSE
jgi:hypothetical protein